MTKIDLPSYCCPGTEEITREGDKKCDHEWKSTEEDEDVKFECVKCGRTIWYEVYT